MKMETTLYRAAMEGNSEILLQNKDCLESYLSPNKNTILHVSSQFGNINCVMEILNLLPSMIQKANSDGDMALHVAAREGRSTVVRALIEYANALNEELEDGIGTAKDMMRAVNGDGDTSLHVAVRSHHALTAQLLAKADPEFRHPANNSGETPLYVAAERGYVGLVFAILESCQEPSYRGPGGRTALHAAIIHNLQGCTRILLDWNPSLAMEVDEHGWTPLHYASNFGHVARVKELLNIEKSAAYIYEKHENKTPLHLAATQGHVSVMEELINTCPDSWEMVDIKGRNILHNAVGNNKKKVIKFILNKFPLSRVVNQKDKDGNTPLHLLAASGCYVGDLIKHHKVDFMAFNNRNSTPLDVVYSNTDTESWGITRRSMTSAGAVLGQRNVTGNERQKAAFKKMHHHREKSFPVNRERSAETQMIVSALIAIATFIAAFTIPGGYTENKGVAALAQKAAFKAFVVTDAISFFFAIAAVCIYADVASGTKRNKVSNKCDLAYFCNVIAMGAMGLAFVTGLYAVLGHLSGIGITLCVVGCFFFVLNCLFLRKKLCDS